MPLTPATRKKILKAVKLIERDGLSIRKACKKAGIGKTAYYNHRKELKGDSTLQTIKKGAEKDVDHEAGEVLDTEKERKRDLDILNSLLGRLVQGVNDEVWSPDQVEERLLKLITAKGGVLAGVDRGRQWVQSLTLVDARSITFEDVPEDIRQQLFNEITEEVWEALCSKCRKKVSS